jgi:hypothetical protein
MEARRLIPLLAAVGLGLSVAACGGSSLTAAQVQTKCVRSQPQDSFDLAIDPTLCRCEVRQGVREDHSLAQIDDEFAGDAKTRLSSAVLDGCLNQLFSPVRRVEFLTQAQIREFKALPGYRRLRSALFSG